jgi:nitroreductase
MILDPIKTRRSVLAFSTKPIEEGIVRTLFEAAQLAPSSNNNQPWRFIYATQDNPEEFKTLFDCLVEGNQRYVKNAYMLVLTVAEMISSYKNTPNKYAWHDTGMASILFMIQAQSLGLHTHPMGGYDAGKATAVLHIPEPFQPVAMIAVGYPGQIQDLPEDLQKRQLSPRNRKPLQEVLFKGKFNGGKLG